MHLDLPEKPTILEKPTRYELPAIVPGHRHALRDYQTEGLTAFSSWFEDKLDSREALIALATGLGKTHLAAACIEKVLKDTPDTNIMWVTNREELVSQTQTDLEDFLGMPVDIEQADKTPSGKSPVRITTALTSKGDRLQDIVSTGYSPKLIVIDEAHHSAAQTVDDLKSRFPQARILNLTATPFRRDISRMMSLGKVISQMCIEDAIAAGYLTPIKPAYNNIEVEGLALKLAIKNVKEMEMSVTQLMKQEHVIDASAGAIIAEIGAHPELNKVKGIVYCCDTAHAGAVAASLKSRSPSLRIGEIYHNTSPAERKDTLDKYRRGELDLLVNCMVLTEGFNDPNTNYICNLRPTTDAGLWTQIVGRGLRTAAGKPYCILHDPCDRAKRTGPLHEEGFPSNDDVRRRSILLGRPTSVAEVALSWFRKADTIGDDILKSTALTDLTAPELLRAIKPRAFNALGKCTYRNGRKKIREIQDILDGKVKPRKDPLGIKTLLGICDIPNESERGFSHLRKILAENGWVYCPNLKAPNLPTNPRTNEPKTDKVLSASTFLETHPALMEQVTKLFTKEMSHAQKIECFCDVFPTSPGSRKVIPWLRPQDAIEPKDKETTFTYLVHGSNPAVFYVRTKTGKIYGLNFEVDNANVTTVKPFADSNRKIKVFKPDEVPNIIKPSISSLGEAASDKQILEIAPLLKMSPKECKAAGVTKIVATSLISNKRAKRFQMGTSGPLEYIKTRLDARGEL